MQHFEHLIIGTGQATGTLLGKLISTGDTIAVVEGHKVGGSCVNYGCTPTKTLVASAKAIHQARRGEFFGFEAEPKVDFNRVVERMNEVRNASSSGLENWLTSTENITLFKGWASFTGEKTVEIDGLSISATHIYINTGTSPKAPPIEGINKVSWLDSERLLALEKLPDHLIIIGGGYIGVEFAQVFKRLGSKVTIVQRSSQLMPNEDPEIANNISEILSNEDVNILFNTNAKGVSQKDGLFHVTVSTGKENKELVGDQLLIATGRTPNTERLNLHLAGIAKDQKGFIVVNDHCETNIKNVFAVGDINGHGAFTHTAVNDAEIVIDYLYGGNRKISSRTPIYALFTDPPLGRVGLTEKEAIRKGHKIMTASKQMSTISRAKEMGETQGMAKLIVDADTDLIIGVAILGPGGDEIINMFAAIIHSQIPCKNYREVMLVHPTVSELMPFVLDGLKIVN